MSNIIVGDIVKLIGVPDWLLKDLPADEQEEIKDFIGKTASITDIDKHGYFWLGFGITKEESDHSIYQGHSFGVPQEFIEFENKKE